jgi:hypothetical protein
MKKITLFLSIIFALCINLNAQVECKTIAEIKALEKGTECQYVGTATTTYYYGDFGVMMQDETGAILLYNSNLGAKKAGSHEKIKVTTKNIFSYTREEVFIRKDVIGNYEYKSSYLRRTRNIGTWFLINVNSLKAMLKGNELYHKKV